jgi:phenylalanyl-tRNA synthetase beta chain
MRISYNWLKQFLKTDQNPDELAVVLTDLGLEVESVDLFESVKGGLKGVVVGHVLTCEKHPNADRLKVTTVDVGEALPLQIVCGAANVAAGQKVPVATIGTVLHMHNGESITIKKGKIRDVESFGMICAEDELGLGSSHDGILVLDSKLKPGTALATIYNIESDFIFEIGLTPNRADAMSHLGVARDLRAGLLQKTSVPELQTPSISSFRIDKRTLKIDVKVADSKLVPRYCGVTISGVSVKDSPTWLQNKLKAIGLTPKNNVVDVTNYVLHELGQPLHAFDTSKINGQKINVRTATAGEKLLTLDDQERELHEDDLVIADAQNPLCLAGVFGGKNSGVSNETTAIFLESAYFNPVSVRKTAKRHGLSTDASFRFERGIDPNITEYALKRAALLIQEVAGGEITSDIIDIHPKKIEPFTVFLNLQKAQKIIGQQIPADTIKKILASLDIKINSVTDTGLGLLIPPYRVDVQREIDVIEEILRVYGYNNIQFSKKLNATVANSPRTESFKLENSIATQLAANGFYEMMANSLTSPEYTTENAVKLLNPLSSDLAVLRTNMLDSALEALAYNINRKNKDLKFFEFGKVYSTENGTYHESKKLTLVTTGNRFGSNWITAAQPTSFYELKSIVTNVLKRLGIEKYESTGFNSDAVSEGLQLSDREGALANIGLVHGASLKKHGIKQAVFYAEIDWEAVCKRVTTKLKITDIPKFPEVTRDLALLLDEAVSFNELAQAAKQTEKSLLKSVDLFDVYVGENLPAGKKSYALSFVLQDKDKTLTDSQIDKVMSKLTDVFAKQFEATLR